MAVNIALFEKVFDFIEHHPQAWKQSTWMEAAKWEGTAPEQRAGELNPNNYAECGTQGCLAGWATAFDDRVVVSKTGNIISVDPSVPRPEWWDQYYSTWTFETLGQALFGLDSDQARSIFYYTTKHHDGSQCDNDVLCDAAGWPCDDVGYEDVPVTLEDMIKRVSEVTGHDFTQRGALL